MEYLPTIVAALAVALIVFFAARNIVKKRKRSDCGCGCENCADCGVPRGKGNGT